MPARPVSVALLVVGFTIVAGRPPAESATFSPATALPPCWRTTVDLLLGCRITAGILPVDAPLDTPLLGSARGDDERKKVDSPLGRTTLAGSPPVDPAIARFEALLPLMLEIVVELLLDWTTLGGMPVPLVVLRLSSALLEPTEENGLNFKCVAIEDGDVEIFSAGPSVLCRSSDVDGEKEEDGVVWLCLVLELNTSGTLATWDVLNRVGMEGLVEECDEIGELDNDDRGVTVVEFAPLRARPSGKSSAALSGSVG